jgi:REP element-mobilizing transposase RayT
MTFNPEQHHRRTIRLSGYDYTQNGAYFVTLCAANRECLFGDIGTMGEIHLSVIGKLVQEEWLRTPLVRPEVTLDAFMIMPNHMHFIVVFAHTEQGNPPTGSVGAHGRAPLQRPPKSLGSLVAGFKSITTKRINELRHTPGEPVWQRNYYEQIIRDEAMLNTVRAYIVNNPARWASDPENPAQVR